MPAPATILENKIDQSSVGYHLLVMGPDLFATHPLPPRGMLTIGRAENADVRLEDPLASRHHARLHIGESLQIEDLGSANKTRVRDVALTSAGHIVTVGGFKSNLSVGTQALQAGTAAVFVADLTASGQVSWSKAFASSGDATATLTVTQPSSGPLVQPATAYLKGTGTAPRQAARRATATARSTPPRF